MIHDIGTLPTVYLKPGEMYISSKPTLVSTVLGSCVSVTMFNRRLKIGAICHGMLPSGTGDDIIIPGSADALKYVDRSIATMFSQYERFGVERHEIEVKLFGGADVISSSRAASVGTQNVQTAIEIIKSNGLHFTSSCVGGVSGRKIIFYTHTGEVLLKHLISTQKRA